MFEFALLAAALAVLIEIPLSAKVGAVKPQVLALAPEYGQLVFQRSRVWEIVVASRVRFAILLVRPPIAVAPLMSSIRRLAVVQFGFSLLAAVLVVAAIEA